MNSLKDKSSVYQHEEQTSGYVRNEKNPVDEEHECWASDSGSSSGSYYSNSSRYRFHFINYCTLSQTIQCLYRN